MSTVIDLSDPRTRRALPLAADSGQWARCTTRDGRRLFGIPSSKPSVRYLTNATSCTCPDFKFGRGRDCKHIISVRIVEALGAAR
jgi:hypothetical protein